jgi:hypothetical protein
VIKHVARVNLARAAVGERRKYLEAVRYRWRAK